MKYEIFEHNDLGYQTLMHYGNWRVAILNYIDDCSIDNLVYFEAHHYNDEGFILLEGEAKLIFADIKENKIVDISRINLEKNKVYNVKKDVYHTQVLSKDAKIILVEEKDTGDATSSKFYLNKVEIEKIKEYI